MGRSLMAIAMLMLWTGIVVAQEEQKPATMGGIDSLRAEIAALRNAMVQPVSTGIPPALVTDNLKRDTLIQQLRKDLDAANKASASAVKLSGTMYTYAQFTTHGIDGDNYNKIDVDRVYLTAKATLASDTKFTFTTDVFRQTDSAKALFYGGLAIRVKFAYVEYSPWSAVSFRLGMIPTHWQGFVDGIWKYRVLIANVTDNTRAGYNSSADLGCAATYTLPSKFGEVTALLLNGSGYSSPEADRFKDLAVRASVTPIADQPLVLAGYYYKGAATGKIKQSLGRDRWGGLVSYALKGVTMGLEYNEKGDQGRLTNTAADTTQKGQAISFWGEAKSPFEGFLGSFALLWRFDYVDANTSVGKDISRFTIGGLSCKVNDKLTLILDRQTQATESLVLTRVDKVKIDYDNKWYLHAQLNF
jgi:hypothetical protein